MPTALDFASSSRRGFFAAACTVGAALLLSACGFHMRGSGPGAALPFKTVYVQAADSSPLAADLKRYIEAGGTGVATDPKQADAVIEIQSETRDKQILTLNSQGRVREYTLISRLAFQLKDAAGNILMPPTVVSAQRVLSFNESQVLAKETEENTMYRDMQSDLIQQALRRIAAYKPAAQNVPPPSQPAPPLQSAPQYPSQPQ